MKTQPPSNLAQLLRYLKGHPDIISNRIDYKFVGASSIGLCFTSLDGLVHLPIGHQANLEVGYKFFGKGFLVKVGSTRNIYFYKDLIDETDPQNIKEFLKCV